MPSSASTAEARVRALGHDSHWLRLGHYQAEGAREFESQMDGPEFFLSANGKKNPEDEIFETWKRIQEQPADLSEESAVECRFPGRVVFLRLKVPDLMKPARECPRLKKWLETVSGPSVSLVFSSFYLNNPSSMFGHTFLRVNKEASRKDGRRHELLDYGVNYAANADQSNPVMYAVKGLFGGFPGTFTIMPYYYKVREYNNAESRDLWEYELSLPPAAVDLLLRHLWELGPTYADYWYLTENCSYFVLTLLEAADPTVDVVSGLKKWIVPEDTLKSVYEAPGLVRSYRYRPSVRAEFEARSLLLSEDEAQFLSWIVDHEEIPSRLGEMSTESRRKVFDSALDWMDYKHVVEVQMPETQEFRFKAKLLAERSRIDLPTPALILDPPARELPHLSHGSRRFSLGTKGGGEDSSALLMSYRFSLHDVLDPVMGYPDSAQIQFFDFQVLMDSKSRHLSFEDFGLFEVVTLTPWSRYVHPISWRMKVGLERELSEDAFDVLGARMSGGLGATVQWSRASFYGGLQAAAIHRFESTRPLPEQRSLLVAGPIVTVRNLFSDFFALRADVWSWPESSDASKWTAQGFAGMQYSPSPSGGFRFGLRGNGKESTWSIEGSLYH